MYDKRAQSFKFLNAMNEELQGLLQRKCFESTTLDKMESNESLLSSRSVLPLKNVGANDEKYKARLVAEVHTDTEKPDIIHDITTLKHSSLRIIVCLAGITGYKLRTQDINQVYIQSDEPFRRPIYLKPPRVLNLSPESI